MTINRQIDGKNVQIELTAQELSYAYEEQEHNYDIEDVQNELDCMDDEDFANVGVTRNFTETHIEEIAYKKRENMDKYGMNWEEALGYALRGFFSRAVNE